MKIRTGFVSNSSSSSFILITTVENHEKALAKCDPFVKEVVKEMFWGKEKVFGKDCCVFETYQHYESSSFGGLGVSLRTEEAKDLMAKEKINFEGRELDENGEEYYDEEDYEISEIFSLAFNAYQREIDKNKDEYFSRRTEG